MTIPKGFLIVASLFKEYVDSANFCAHSIKDHYPDAHVTLFVSDRVRQFADESAFDLIISDDVPDHSRTKLYALSRTPYSEMTVYVDADMECQHEDIATIWDQLSKDDDILITKIRPYNGKISKWNSGRLIHHCGFFVYRTKPHILEFMEKWWLDYEKQRREPWPYTEEQHPKELQPWDQFTFWKLINLDGYDININFFKDDARWNFVNGYRSNETTSPIIFYHHTVIVKHNANI
jgi:hypothetical protein